MNENNPAYTAPFEGAHPFGGTNDGKTLYGPTNKIVCDLRKSEPEDLTWDRDLKEVVTELNVSHNVIRRFIAVDIMDSIRFLLELCEEKITSVQAQNFEKGSNLRDSEIRVRAAIDAIVGKNPRIPKLINALLEANEAKLTMIHDQKFELAAEYRTDEKALLSKIEAELTTTEV